MAKKTTRRTSTGNSPSVPSPVPVSLPWEIEERIKKTRKSVKLPPATGLSSLPAETIEPDVTVTVAVMRTETDGTLITDTWPKHFWDRLPFNPDGSKGDSQQAWRLASS